MKKLLILCISVLSLFAASWDPHTGNSIEAYKESSFQARFKTNERQRTYSSLYSLLKDEQSYGLKTFKAYTRDTKQYEEVTTLFFVYPLPYRSPFGKYASVAFRSQERALAYAKEHKAEVIDFEKLLHVMLQGMKKDETLMHTRFKKRAYPMGKRIYEKQCKAIEPSEFMEMSELKTMLVDDAPCGVLNEERLQAVSLYLWHVKRKGDLGEVEGRVEVREDEKCPVCGMFVYKYPKWTAQIAFKHDGHEHRLSFDGVKDMMKFYFNPSKWGNYPYATPQNITQILVSDYYSGRGIDGRKAFYVIRSDIYGPMGHELIPFESEEEAKTFLKEHRGTQIIPFENITESLAYELD
jgi:nitrous oxide reductase accessory protein NosL